jgi:hypothetical protein
MPLFTTLQLQLTSNRSLCRRVIAAVAMAARCCPCPYSRNPPRPTAPVHILPISVATLHHESVRACGGWSSRPSTLAAGARAALIHLSGRSHNPGVGARWLETPLPFSSVGATCDPPVARAPAMAFRLVVGARATSLRHRSSSPCRAPSTKFLE